MKVIQMRRMTRGIIKNKENPKGNVIFSTIFLDLRDDTINEPVFKKRNSNPSFLIVALLIPLKAHGFSEW
jgi:hypothetical protein